MNDNLRTALEELAEDLIISFEGGQFAAASIRALLAAHSAPETDLHTRVADTLAYYQCRRTNPKADDPISGYHTFHPDQRAHLQEQQAEAAAEVVRMFHAEAAGTLLAAHPAPDTVTEWGIGYEDGSFDHVGQGAFAEFMYEELQDSENVNLIRREVTKWEVVK